MTKCDLFFNLVLDYSAREITVCGEFDVATAPCFATAVSRLQKAAIGDITVRFDKVTFIDAAGMGAVVAANSTQTITGGHLALAGANARVQKMFLIAQLGWLLQPS